jgi:hypothetical protein
VAIQLEGFCASLLAISVQLLADLDMVYQLSGSLFGLDSVQDSFIGVDLRKLAVPPFAVFRLTHRNRSRKRFSPYPVSFVLFA